MTQVALPAGPSLVEGYRAVAGDGAMRVLEALAGRLHGHRIVMVNSTATGGGVAEILQRLVPLLNELGVPTAWEVMEGDAHGEIVFVSELRYQCQEIDLILQIEMRSWLVQ